MTFVQAETCKQLYNFIKLKQTNMKGFKSNIEKETLKNENFRQVLYTSKHLQLVLMTLKTGEEIGEEVHIGKP